MSLISTHDQMPRPLISYLKSTGWRWLPEPEAARLHLPNMPTLRIAYHLQNRLWVTVSLSTLCVGDGSWLSTVLASKASTHANK